jgi:hypothetical protein
MKKADMNYTIIILIVVLLFFLFTSPIFAKMLKSGNLFFFQVGEGNKCAQTGKSFSEYKNSIEELNKNIKADPLDSSLKEKLTKECNELKVCFLEEYVNFEAACKQSTSGEKNG